MSKPTPRNPILTATVGGVVITLDASDANLTQHQLGTLHSKMADISSIVGGVTLDHPVRHIDLDHPHQEVHNKDAGGNFRVAAPGTLVQRRKGSAAATSTAQGGAPSEPQA